MGRLQDRVSIVTGAGDGIGRGIARVFAREGARVMVAELDPDAGAAVVDEITTEFGTEAYAVTTDVADEAAVREMVAATVDEKRVPSEVPGIVTGQEDCNRRDVGFGIP